MGTNYTTNHIGRKIARMRELRGMKQEAMAIELGVSQQTISNMEKSTSIEADLLAQVAKILKVPEEAIQNFDEEGMINYFNTFNDEVSGSFNTYHGCSFNPIDKLVEVFEENKKLYERLLEAEKSKIEYLEKLKDK